MFFKISIQEGGLRVCRGWAVPDNTQWLHVTDKTTPKNEGLCTVIRDILSHTVKTRKDILIFTDRYAPARGLPFHCILLGNNA